MKAFTISATLALLVATVCSAPTASSPEERQFEVAITFNGADPDAYFFQSFPADDSTQEITNPLSVTSISSVGGGFCTFTGIDGSETVVYGEQTVPVGPPQTQVSGSCQTA